MSIDMVDVIVSLAIFVCFACVNYEKHMSIHNKYSAHTVIQDAVESL